ncbi:DNA (cytosine-5-)-methyltransferase [Allofranklinella schreckenbergeri]|uniref:DNA (cytosine-5-)-methyltransferase n=1 Tax=Allofranklinella schreckenbergeri TaxID=1076744 RepID=A0A3M6PYF6_9BURK|nr:DNA (cytosine-5-)-methyltransferase [Allofranklinella schreckenbergeri]RMW96047.1 DNA (cytosine-5-)-methyltransferase [Allofranklinella schreckenbergeri]
MDANKAATTSFDGPSVGSLFAGIGGFDLGFEQAGFTTAWQVEIEPRLRDVLALRFPHARQFADVRDVGAHNLRAVDVLVGGFPCQDVSSMGRRAGLAGQRTGLFWQVCRIADEIRPQWLVLENVVGLLNSNAGRDFGTVVQALAKRGYVGCWRVLDSQYFGVAQGRRRVFLVAGLGRQPPIGLLADAAPVAAIPRTLAAQQESRPEDGWAAYCLLAKLSPSLLAIGAENLVCHRGGRGAMLERARVSETARIPTGLDATDHAEARAAGNAVCVPVARWIAQHLMAEISQGQQ